MQKVNQLATGLFTLVTVLCHSFATAEVVEYGGAPDALPHAQYVHVVSETISPVESAFIKSQDGAYVAAAIRKPAGTGPFPAVVMFHGAPGGRGIEQLRGWARGDHGGPVWERYLQEGFVVVVADYRGGDLDLVNAPSNNGVITAIDDGVAVVDYVSALPYVDAAQVSVYGVSLGGNLALFLAARLPNLKAVVVGAPAPVWFLGVENMQRFAVVDGGAPALKDGVAAANIAPIQAPILIQVGTADFLRDLSTILHDQLVSQGKTVRLEIYEHGYHDFVLGPQGHTRPDLPEGEKLMQAGLDALERSVAFIRNPLE